MLLQIVFFLSAAIAAAAVGGVPVQDRHNIVEQMVESLNLIDPFATTLPQSAMTSNRRAERQRLPSASSSTSSLRTPRSPRNLPGTSAPLNRIPVVATPSSLRFPTGPFFQTPMSRSETHLPQHMSPTLSSNANAFSLERENDVDQLWTRVSVLHSQRNYREALETLELLKGRVMLQSGGDGQRAGGLYRLPVYYDSYISDLAFYYNRAVLQLTLYHRTRQARLLQNAGLDFDIATRKSGHFYPAYIGRAVIAVIQKSYHLAFQTLRDTLDVLLLQRRPGLPVLMYDENIYKGALFLADLYADLGMVTYHMGANVDSQRFFQTASQVLAESEVEAMTQAGSDPVMQERIRAFFELKRTLYYHHAHNQPSLGVLLSFSSALLLTHTSNDVGIIRWMSVADVLNLQSLEMRQRKRSSSGLTARMLSQFHKAKSRKRWSREREQQASSQQPRLPTRSPPLRTTKSTGNLRPSQHSEAHSAQHPPLPVSNDHYNILVPPSIFTPPTNDVATPAPATSASKWRTRASKALKLGFRGKKSDK